jgi:hypothetical protein
MVYRAFIQLNSPSIFPEYSFSLIVILDAVLEDDLAFNDPLYLKDSEIFVMGLLTLKDHSTGVISTPKVVLNNN